MRSLVDFYPRRVHVPALGLDVKVSRMVANQFGERILVRLFVRPTSELVLELAGSFSATRRTGSRDHGRWWDGDVQVATYDKSSGCGCTDPAAKLAIPDADASMLDPIPV